MADKFHHKPDHSTPLEIRIDRWLWAARFFKTRQLAVTAIKAGKVELNAHKAKPSKLVKVGDRLKIRRERFIFEVDVLALNDKRLGAVAAQALYREQDMSRERREKLIMEMAAERKSVRFADGRPGKRDRRVLEQFKREGYKP